MDASHLAALPVEVLELVLLPACYVKGPVAGGSGGDGDEIESESSRPQRTRVLSAIRLLNLALVCSAFRDAIKAIPAARVCIVTFFRDFCARRLSVVWRLRGGSVQYRDPLSWMEEDLSLMKEYHAWLRGLDLIRPTSPDADDGIEYLLVLGDRQSLPSDSRSQWSERHCRLEAQVGMDLDFELWGDAYLWVGSVVKGPDCDGILEAAALFLEMKFSDIYPLSYCQGVADGAGTTVQSWMDKCAHDFDAQRLLGESGAPERTVVLSDNGNDRTYVLEMPGGYFLLIMMLTS